jgi:hypothetical protein
LASLVLLYFNKYKRRGIKRGVGGGSVKLILRRGELCFNDRATD